MVKIGEIERKEGQEVCEFEYLTRGRVSPNGRQYVYFTCHPDDFDSHFSEIVQIVLKKYDCAVWYNLNQLDDEKEYTHRLGEMQLFIIPITKNFLTEPCRARNIDLPFALNHFIPVLPLMQTSGLNESFEKICGDLHYIDKNACDETTLTYEQKIHKFLSMSLISDDLTRKIREAFYARIFLSYRKKDRAFANKLMGLIHDVPFCRDIAIWFDEYLVPGQNFNDAIADAMRNSRLFVLCVTENLLEEGNYIQKVEYPQALELSLPIMPIVLGGMSEEQTNLLREQYHDFPKCIDSNDSGWLTKELYVNFTDIAMAEQDNGPMHLFLIGCAYLNGIEVEVNHCRAVDLISQAANQGYWPAIEKLAYMYRIGEGVIRNLGKSLALYEKLLKAISDNDNEKSNLKHIFEIHFDLLNLLLDSDSLFRYEHMDCVKSHTMGILKVATKLKLSDSEILKMFSLLAFVNECDEDISNRFITSSLELLQKVCENENRIQAEKAFFYSRLASLYYQRSAGFMVYNITSNPVYGQRRKQSEHYIVKAIELFRDLYEQDPIKWKADYANALYILCSMNYSQRFCSDQNLVKAIGYTIELHRELCKDSATLYAAKLAKLCWTSGDYLANDVDFRWAAEDYYHDLNPESYVPGTPEQRIPVVPEFVDNFEEYDFLRIRKALSLMRYGVIVYEDYISEGQSDCWIDLAEACFCLSRLLYCLSVWIEDVQINGIEKIRMELLLDSFKGYRKMLKSMRNFLVQHPHFKYERSGTRCSSSNMDSDSLVEKDLVRLEMEAYEDNPFAECYNFALALSNNGLNQESVQLHEDLYHFFKEVYQEANPNLILMNLYAYACSKPDVDETLSLLVEFDSVEEKEKYNQPRFNDTLFDYYCEIAQCYMEKRNPTAAERYFAKAKETKSYFTPYQYTCFSQLWALNKKNAGDLPGSEKLILEGLEFLMRMDEIPAELWNELSQEYVSLLILMKKTKEADVWRNEMLID